jgi:hypothetical protein
MDALLLPTRQQKHSCRRVTARYVKASIAMEIEVDIRGAAWILDLVIIRNVRGSRLSATGIHGLIMMM